MIKIDSESLNTSARKQSYSENLPFSTTKNEENAQPINHGLVHELHRYSLIEIPI